MGRPKKRTRSAERYIAYDYEAAFTEQAEKDAEWTAEAIARNRREKVVYALKEIRSGDQLEVQIYPQFKCIEDVPEAGRRPKKDNAQAQRNLNDKNARQYVERLINANFGNKDLWVTLTYDEEHEPEPGDIDGAIRNVQKYIRRINYRRKRIGLPNARYVYVTEYNPDAKIRWHHHLVMDGDLDMDTVEACWGQSSRNQTRRLQKDENGLSGMANYIVKEKERIRSEKRWNSSQGLIPPDVAVTHSKRTDGKTGTRKTIRHYVEQMLRDREEIERQMIRWYGSEYDFTSSDMYYNNVNQMFYIAARMRLKGGTKADGSKRGSPGKGPEGNAGRLDGSGRTAGTHSRKKILKR